MPDATPSVPDAKRELRRELKARRAALTPEERDRKSRRACQWTVRLIEGEEAKRLFSKRIPTIAWKVAALAFAFVVASAIFALMEGKPLVWKVVAMAVAALALYLVGVTGTNLAVLAARRAGRLPRRTVSLYRPIGDELDVLPLARGLAVGGYRLCFPALVTDKREGGGSDSSTATMGTSNVTDAAKDAATEDAPHGTPAGTPDGTPKPRMAFYVVDREQLEDGSAPFMADPLRTFDADGPELAGFAPVPYDEIDYAICPLLGFDPELYRIGYGGGYYDRLLAGLGEDALAIGIAFSEQYECQVPHEEHDRRLDIVVTDLMVWN